MKLFVPFDESQISGSGSHDDQLVPYQVGMPCADWYQIIPVDQFDVASSMPQRESTALPS